MADNVKQVEARRWVDSLADKWRLQVLSKRERLNPRTGERKELPTRIRRFAEGIPWAYVPEGIRYLVSLAPYRGVIFNGVELDDEYRPTVTTWQRDDQSAVNGQGRTDGTYTLVQDLVSSDVEDVYSAVSSSSCSEEVVTEWHWDESEPVSLPAPEQGVTYQLANVGRKDDGTFDYAVVKRTAITQHAGVAVEKDDAVETVYVNSWDNVYTDDAGRYVDNYGNRIDEFDFGVEARGAYKFERQENADCTFRISVTLTVAKSATVREVCEKNLFQHEHVVGKTGQDSPLGEAPEAAGGLVVKHEDQLQPDGLFSTIRTEARELPVEDARVRVSVGRRGRRAERVSRNQPLPLSTDGLEVGHTVEVEKTPGGLFNNTDVVFERVRDRVAESCEDDLFKHWHSTTVSGVDGIPESHVSGGSDGKTVKRRTDMDDEGSIVQVVSVDEEKPVRKSRESWVVGLRGVRHTVVDTQVPGPAPVPPAFTRDNIGKELVVEKTPGGLFNITIEETVRGDSVRSGGGCSKTVFEHQDTTVTNDPAGGFAGHVLDAGGGKYYESDGRLNDDGSSTVTQVVHDELPVLAAELEIRKTAKAVFTTRTDRNVPATAQEPSGIGVQRHTTNRGGTHDVTVTVVEPLGKPDRARCETSVFEHQHDKVTVAVGDRADSTDAPVAGNGKRYVKDSQVDDNGLVTTVVRETSELPRDWVSRKQKTIRGTTLSRTYRNSQDSKAGEVVKVGDEVSANMTPGGLFDVVVTGVDPNASDTEIALQDTRTVFAIQKSKTINRRDKGGEEAKGAGDGRTHGVSLRLTEIGTWDRTEEDNEELPKEWVSRKQRTIRGTVTSTTYRNSEDNKLDMVEEVGDEVSAGMTPGGRYDVVVTKREPSGNDELLGLQDSRTVFGSDHSETVNVSDRDDEYADEAGEGRTHGLEFRLTELGTWDRTDRLGEEFYQEDAQVSQTENFFGSSETHKGRNNHERVALPVWKDASGDIFSVQNSMTPGGRFDTTVELEKAKDWDLEYYYVYRGKKYQVVKWGNKQPDFWKRREDPKDEDPATANTYGQLDVSLNKFGLEDGTFTKVSYVGGVKSDLLSINLRTTPQTRTEHKIFYVDGEPVTKQCVQVRLKYEKLFDEQSAARDYVDSMIASGTILESHSIDVFRTILGHAKYALTGYSPWVMHKDWYDVEDADRAVYLTEASIKAALRRLV